MLTASNVQVNLSLPLTHSAVGIGTPETTGQKAALHAVFYCPPQKPAVLLCLAFVMVDCSGEPSGSPVPVAGSSNPAQSATPRLEPTGGGYSTLQETATMRNPTSKLAKSASNQYQSRFNVVTRSGRSLVRRVPFSEAVSVKNHHPKALIKFAGLEVRHG